MVFACSVDTEYTVYAEYCVCLYVYAVFPVCAASRVQVTGDVFGVDPHLKSSANEQLYRWQWRKVVVYEAARRMLIEALSRKKTSGSCGRVVFSLARLFCCCLAVTVGLILSPYRFCHLPPPPLCNQTCFAGCATTSPPLLPPAPCSGGGSR